MLKVNMTPLNPDRPKYRVSDGVRELFRLAKEEPYRSINRSRGTSIEFFEYMLSGLDPFLQRFEEEAGIEGASVWNGLRLHECPDYPLASIVTSHISGNYYSGYNGLDDSASILLENYGSWMNEGGAAGGADGESGQRGGKAGLVYYYTYTMPHFAIIRPVHIDAQKHMLGLGIPEWEKKAMKAWNTLKGLAAASVESGRTGARNPDDYIANMNMLFRHMKEVYDTFPDVMHALSSVCFEIEAHMNDAPLLQNFDKIIMLPPHESVVAALRELTTHPLEHKMPDDEYFGRKAVKSKIAEYIDSIDMEQLRNECIQSARNHVTTIRTIRSVYQSLAEKDYGMFDEYVKAFEKTQEEAGLFEPFEFVDRHITERIGDSDE